jgi:hypothetical protein
MSSEELEWFRRAMREEKLGKVLPWMERVLAGIGEVERKRRAEQDALERIDSATARWSDYLLVLHDPAQDSLLKALPSFAVRRARRLAGIPRGTSTGIGNGVVEEAFELLSYQPEELLPDDLRDAPEAWARTVDNPTADAYERTTAALALMIVGPEGGLPRRSELWRSDAAEQRSSEQCDRLCSWNTEILDWELIDEVLRTSPEVEGFIEPEPGSYYVMSYAAVGAALGLYRSDSAA